MASYQGLWNLTPKYQGLWNLTPKAEKAEQE
jgi:hypothetical protein